jgi:hypothetical protein
MTLVGRVLLALLLFVVGAAVALATVAVHGWTWGLVLGVVGSSLALWALPPSWWGRLAFAVGWGGCVAYFTVPRPEGDYLVGSDVGGYALLVAALTLFLVAVVTLPRPGRRVPEHTRPHA